MAGYDGSIRINTILNTLGLRRGEDEIRGSMSRISGAAKKIAGVIAGAFAVGKIAEFGKEAIEAASDLEAMESQFSQVFGDLETKASQSLSKMADQAGITEERMKASYTKIAAFAKTTGMDTAGSMELADRAMVAVADSAAFYDRSLEETTESLQSFLKGNYENDASLGLSATEFTRNAAANKLYGKSFIELSEAQKQLTLLQMVEDANRLSGALGQASRESDTWANQTGNLNQAWTSLKANLGKFVLPMAVQSVKSIANVINVINAMLSKLYTASSAFRSFSELITGKKSQAGTSSGLSKGEGASMASGYNEAAEGAENLAGANEKVAKAAGKAAKAANKQLSSLDKLNNLSSSDSSSGGGSGSGGSGGGAGGALQDVDYGKAAEGETRFGNLDRVLDSVISKIKEMAGLFKQGFFEGLGDYGPRLDDLKKDIGSIGNTLKNIFTSPDVVASVDRFSNQIALSLGQITGSVASIGLTIASNLVGGMEKYLTQNVDRIKGYIVSMFDIGTEIAAIIGDFSVAFADIFSVFGGDTAQQITGNLIGIFAEVGMMISENAAKLGRDILNMIAQPIIDNKDKIKMALEGTLQAIEPFTSGLLTALQSVRDAVSNVYDSHLKPLFDSIANGLSGILGKLLDGYNTYMLPVLQGLGEKFREIMEGPFGETVNKVKDFIGKLVDAVKLLWESVLVPFFGWIADNIMPILAPIVDFIGNTFLTVYKTIVKVIGNIADALGGVIDFVVGVFTGDWKKAWDGIKSIFSGIWNTIKDIFIGIWDIIKNLVINGVEIVRSVIEAAWNGIKSVTSTVWNAIKGFLTTIWNGLKSLVLTVFNAIKTAISTAWNGIKTITSTVWKSIKSALSSAWSGIKSIFSNVGSWFKNKFDKAYKSVTDAFSGVGSFFSNVWSNIKGAFGGIIKWFEDKFSKAWEAVKNVFSTGGKIFDGIKDGILNGLKTVINAIISGINKVIEIPFRGLNSALTKLKSVNIAGLKPFDWMPTIDVPQIPRLATGAVIPANKEFLAVLGDQKHGRNLEAPEGLIRKIIREETAGLDKGSGEITLNLTVECEGYKLLQLIQKLDKEQYNKTGEPSFQM